MKNLIVIVALFSAFNLFAQTETKPTNFCGSNHGRSEWLKNYQKNKKDFDSRGSEPIYMPMTVFLLSNDDGKKGYNFGTFLDDFYVLNKDFEQANMRFFLKSPVRYIKNTAINNHKTFDEGLPMYDNNVENTVNSYFVSDPAGNCGYDWPGKGIALNKGCMGKFNHTWAHEMGHELSLPHTFVGWEGENIVLSQKAPLEINGNTVELLDKSNCATAADGFCDTQADYLSYRWACGADKKTSYDVIDPTGQKFKINGDLFMSYALDACTSKFSPEQSGAMRAHSTSEKIDFLATQNPHKPLVGISKNNTPSDSTMNVDFEKAQFSWSKVGNASHYYVEISRLPSFNSVDISESVTDTFFTIKLLPTKRYYWRVRAYNYGYTTFSDVLKSTVFWTSSPAVSVNELTLNEFIVYPNPVAENQEINIQFEADFSEKIKMELIDISGKTLITKDLNVENGENKTTLKTDFPKGIYFLQLKSKRGIKVEKVVI